MSKTKNAEQYQDTLLDDVKPIALEDRTLTGKSTFAIWFACNLVVTTILTGMYMIPDLSYAVALRTIFIGSAIGIIPLTLIALMGTKTGLSTMTMSRATFGIKGSMMPSSINIMILIAWSWAQAGLGGLALNYASVHLTGFSNPVLFIIITEIIVVAIALYAIKGIALYEKIAMVVLVVIMGAVVITAIRTFTVSGIFSLPSYQGEGLATIAVFDLVVATALSWTPLAADYNRNCKTERGSVIGASVGYTLGTTLSMGIGALVIVMITLGGLEIPFDSGGIEPSQAFGTIGFGIAGSIVIFMSVLAANVMCIYSSSMSFLNIFPKAGFKKTALTIGAICVIGAVFSGILGAFLDFVFLIGALFIPLFAIMIADFFVVQNRNFKIEAILFPESYDTYRYSGGVNINAVVVYLISAALAYYWIAVNPIAIGATIPTFFIAFGLYIAASKIINKK